MEVRTQLQLSLCNDLSVSFVLISCRFLSFGNEGPGDGSFMLGCDNCDRWFHGSCMKIDKETGDALSKWICPPCSKSVSVEAVKVQENHGISGDKGDKKLPAQEINNPQLIQPQLAQPYHDISPHAPNPTSLWPPFDLRSSKEAVEALGKVGESDNEDFEVPIQPIARVKSDPNAYPQNLAPQVASAASLSMQNVSQFPLCQPIASVNSGSNAHPQNNVSQVASVAAAPSASQAPTYQTQAGTAQAAQRVEFKYPGVLSNSLPSQPMPLKTNRQPLVSTQMPFSQYSTGPNALSSIAPFTTSTVSYRSEQTVTNSINTRGLHGANLSAAVANMDHYVLSAGDNAGFQRVSTSPIPPVAMGSNAPLPTNSAMQMGVPNTAPMRRANCQSYTATTFPQATPKAP